MLPNRRGISENSGRAGTTRKNILRPACVALPPSIRNRPAVRDPVRPAAFYLRTISSGKQFPFSGAIPFAFLSRFAPVKAKSRAGLLKNSGTAAPVLSAAQNTFRLSARTKPIQRSSIQKAIQPMAFFLVFVVIVKSWFAAFYFSASVSRSPNAAAFSKISVPGGRVIV